MHGLGMSDSELRLSLSPLTPPAPTPAPARLADPADSALRQIAPDDGLDAEPHPASAEFCWPMPALASYPAAKPQVDPEPCEVVGHNGRVMSGRLIFFVPGEQVAHIQIPPARTTMALRFSQFRALHLSRAISPLSAQPTEGVFDGRPSSAKPEDLDRALEQRPPTPYELVLRNGERCTGQTIGWVEQPSGWFLFPPQDAHGTLTRVFYPREAVASASMGAPLGQMLVLSDALSADQVQMGVDLQNNLRHQKLGEVLLAQQVVTPEQLSSALAQQARMPMMRIGEALVALGLISQLQLSEALRQQQSDRSVPLGELLVRLGLINRGDLLQALARKMGYPVVDVQHFPMESAALQKLPFAAAARLKALPLMQREGQLVVAVADPSQSQILAEVEFLVQAKVAPVLAEPLQLNASIKAAYTRMGADVSGVSMAGEGWIDAEELSTDQLVQDLEREGGGASAAASEQAIEQSDNSLVRLINTMIVEACNQGVSDIHIESYPGREKVKIRFRKDGQLLPYLELPHNYRSAVIARIKIMCDLDISERRKPQDGKINFARFMPRHRVELRVATIPTHGGMEDVVMRILSSARPLPLDKLNLSPRNLAAMQAVMERPYGLVLCVGPTGSGKTTTLHSALSFINVPERKIWTAEDPVEITQPGLRQVQINHKIDWTFEKALRAFLRADPDVIMVGEMRDAPTARMAIEASLTGHLVLSTLHTNSAPETVTRLLDMGMDPFGFADALLAVLAQRLVRRWCRACVQARPMQADEREELLDEYVLCEHAAPADLAAFRERVRQDWQARFARDGVLQRHHAAGCPSCQHSGYQGRLGIHEFMAVDGELRRLIQTNSSVDSLRRHASAQGMRTLRQDGIEKVLAGLTSLDEVRATSNG